jgi:transcription factor C subunit 7
LFEHSNTTPGYMTDYTTMGKRTLYLVRHGQRLDAINSKWFAADDNKYDPPLSEQGHWQAQRLAERLSQEPIDWLFSSPYLRALQTMQPTAAALDMPFYVDDGIGEWLSKAMITHEPKIVAPIKRAADFAHMGLTHSSKVQPIYPETVQEVFERLHRAVNSLLASYEGNLLLVGHGRTVTGIAHRLTGQPESNFKYELTGITKLVLNDGVWEVRLNGDISHLSETTMPHFV